MFFKICQYPERQRKTGGTFHIKGDYQDMKIKCNT